MAQEGHAIERLRTYLGQLPPQARTLLKTQFERALARGEDVAVAAFVLRELNGGEAGAVPAAQAPPLAPDEPVVQVDPARALFKCLDAFVVDRGRGAASPGQMDRGSLAALYAWLRREVLVEATHAYEEALQQAENARQPAKAEQVVRQFQFQVAETIGKAIGEGKGADEATRRSLARVGHAGLTDDLPLVMAVFKMREQLDALNARLPTQIMDFGRDQISMITQMLDVPSMQSTAGLALAMRIIMGHLTSRFQLVRLVKAMVESDDGMRIAGSPYGVAVTIVIDDMARAVAQLRELMSRTCAKEVRAAIKSLHDNLRGLRTEIEIRPDSPWGKQIAGLKGEVSGLLRSEIETVPGKMRRMLRIGGVAPIDEQDVTELANRIELTSACRSYAGELALNEASLRSWNDVKQSLEGATQALIDSLRHADDDELPVREAQVKAALKFCGIVFGLDYAATVSRAADVALQAERKKAEAKGGGAKNAGAKNAGANHAGTKNAGASNA